MRTPTLNDVAKAAYERALEVAEALGREAGEQAGRWVTDGNTTMRTYEVLLRGIEDGDPEILDMLPHADFSGQWGGSYSVDDLVCDLADEAGEYRAEWLDDIIDAYSYGFAGGAQDAVTADCHYHLTPEIEEC